MRFDANLPDYTDGLSPAEYDTLVDTIVDEVADSEDPIAALDDLIANLRLFGLGEYYKQAYRDIIAHGDAGPDGDIARVDTVEGADEHLMVKASEVLIADAQRRLLNQQ